MAVSYITVVDDGLALSYAVLAVVALIQLARIHLRLPHVTWTTQKVFMCLIIVTASLRAAVFACRSEVEEAVRGAYPFVYEVLLDGPGLLFFSTFTLLILFWAEIYYQATVTSRLGEGGEDGGAGREEANPPQKRCVVVDRRSLVVGHSLLTRGPFSSVGCFCWPMSSRTLRLLASPGGKPPRSLRRRRRRRNPRPRHPRLPRLLLLLLHHPSSSPRSLRSWPLWLPTSSCSPARASSCCSDASPSILAGGGQSSSRLV